MMRGGFCLIPQPRMILAQSLQPAHFRGHALWRASGNLRYDVAEDFHHERVRHPNAVP